MDLMNINFMQIRKQTTILSVALILISIGSLFINKLNLGLDFTGGTLIEVRLEKEISSLEEIRVLLREFDLSA